MIRTSSATPLRIAINKSKDTVFLGGAGVSTECGIPDFRSSDGIFSRMATTILRESTLRENPSIFWDNYRTHLLPDPKIEPGLTHKVLADLELTGRLSSIVTQNIDCLHQKAGSKTVREVHGSADKNYCMECGRTYSLDYILGSSLVPLCSCGGVIRPDIVLYGENVKDSLFTKAENDIRKCDLLVIGGTSMMVDPVASLMRKLKKGALCIMVNKEPTEVDRYCNIVIQGKIADIFGDL